METKLHVDLGKNSYDIRVEPGLLLDIAQGVKPIYPEGRVFVVTDEHVDALYGAKVMGSLEGAGYRPGKLVLPPGEKTKAYATMARVYRAMADAKLTRKDLVLTLRPT